MSKKTKSTFRWRLRKDHSQAGRVIKTPPKRKVKHPRVFEKGVESVAKEGLDRQYDLDGIGFEAVYDKGRKLGGHGD